MENYNQRNELKIKNPQNKKQNKTKKNGFANHKILSWSLTDI